MGKSLEDQKRNWNELEFISWKEFQQMAPSILQLEITRISRLLQSYRFDANFHNSLVKVRFELKSFIECLEKATQIQVESNCAIHLQNALICMPTANDTIDQTTHETLNYILDRIKYVNDRIKLIY